MKHQIAAALSLLLSGFSFGLGSPVPKEDLQAEEALTPSLRHRELVNGVCWDSSDCRHNLYCRQGNCRRGGTCASDVDCKNPWNIYAIDTCSSGGYQECLSGQCVTVCDGYKCPPFQTERDCPREPCSWYDGCDHVPSGSRCVNNECDGCKAVFYDPRGNVVCTTEVAQPTSEPPPRGCGGCRNNQYCMRGQCRAKGYCESRLDCQNPANQFSFIRCPNGGGFIDCINHQCEANCSSPDACPVELPQQNCQPSPCKYRTCTAAVSCYDDICGSCNPVFFDDEGYEVCKVDACGNDNQCDTNQYCASGRCLNIGKCDTYRDCQNPSNQWTRNSCGASNGYETCDSAGTCKLVCGNEPCPPGKPFANCQASPCENLSCDEVPDARCVNYKCGGCQAVFFDPAGHEVCEASFKPQACTRDANCGRNEYCSQGICRAQGTCTSREDCLNPSNVFPEESCTGYITCESGSCAKVCSSSTCPPGLQYVPGCKEAPCGTRTCSSASSCTNDYCGGCNAIFFDQAGNNVCRGCKRDGDCARNTYCSSGECREHGRCRTLTDCLNDSNNISLPNCGGYLTCKYDDGRSDGRCTLECTDLPCPPGQTQVRCMNPPCAQTDCPVTGTQCHNNMCGECSAIFIDAAGSEVCDGIATSFSTP